MYFNQALTLNSCSSNGKLRKPVSWSIPLKALFTFDVNLKRQQSSWFSRCYCNCLSAFGGKGDNDIEKISNDRHFTLYQSSQLVYLNMQWNYNATIATNLSHTKLMLFQCVFSLNKIKFAIQVWSNDRR